MFSPLDDKTYNNLAEESQNHLVERLYELIDLLSPNEKAILFLYLKSADIKNTTSATANIVEEEPKTEAIPTPQTTTAKPKCGTIECQDWCDNQEILAELNYIIETSYKV